MSTATKGGLGGGVAAVVAVAGWAVFQPRPPAPEATVEPAALIAPVEEVAAEPVAEVAAEPAPETPAVVVVLAPAIDVLRIAPDGLATLAGRAEPSAQIAILVDGAEVATVGADASGQFATVFTLAPSEAARMLTLLAKLADGTEIAGAEAVAIAPVVLPEPEVVAAEAEAEPAPEPEAPATLKVTEAGVEVLQPAEPVPAELAAEVSLDVIAYTDAGAVQLGGSGMAGALLRLYLDNAPLSDVTVAADGKWALTTDAIAPGVYTLRVDQLDAGGQVVSRLETPFKRETLEALAAAAEPAAEPEVVAAVEPEAAEVVEPATAEPTTAEPVAEPAAEPEATPAPEVVATAEPAAPEPDAPATDAATDPALAVTEGEATDAQPAEADPATLATATTEAVAPAADAAPAASPAPITVTVQPGFTLWAIAKANFGEGIMYVQVYEANKDKIKDPDLIYPGQVLSVPASP